MCHMSVWCLTASPWTSPAGCRRHTLAWLWKPKYKFAMKIVAITLGKGPYSVIWSVGESFNFHSLTVLLKISFTATSRTLRFYVGLSQQWLLRMYKTAESSWNWELSLNMCSDCVTDFLLNILQFTLTRKKRCDLPIFVKDHFVKD